MSPVHHHPYRTLIWVLLIIAFGVLMLFASSRRPGARANIVDRQVSAWMIRTANLFSSSWEFGTGLSSRYVLLVGTEEENTRLRQELRAARKEMIILRSRASEGERLARTMQFIEHAGLSGATVGARVVGVNVTPFFRVAQITVERNPKVAHLLERGSPVLTPEGVVGIIHRTNGSRGADVLLLTDERLSLDVVVERSGARGIATGLGTGDTNYGARVSYLLKEEDIREGDLLVTAGTSGMFPQGIPVGTVSRVVRKEYGLYQEVELSPSVKLGRLKEVFVLTSGTSIPASAKKSRRERGER